MPAYGYSTGVALGARLALLGLLALAWGDVRWPASDGATALDAVVLVDDSLSVTPSMRERGWAATRRWLGDLPAGSEVAIVRFAATPALERPFAAAGTGSTRHLFAAPAPPRTADLERGATDLASALTAAARLRRPGRDLTVLVLSDWQENVGQVESRLDSLREAGIGVKSVDLAPAPATGTRLDALYFPPRARAGQPLSGYATVRSSGGGPHEVVASADDTVFDTWSGSLAAGTALTVPLRLTLEHPGVHRVRAVARALDGSSIPAHDTRHALITVDGREPVLHVTLTGRTTRFADSLRVSGRPSRTVSGAELAPALTGLGPSALVVLEDLPAAGVSDHTWALLERAVRRDGVGLAVLGGPGSFGAGGYRHSALEPLLPVTAEAREGPPPAAVAFAIDTSGSMGQREGGLRRMDLALQAVAETGETLLAEDRVGLIAFDADARVLLALRRRGPEAVAATAVHDLAPSGGTRLRPALERALAMLADDAAERRFLVLVTDGFVPDEALDDLQQAFVDAGIEIVALAVGRPGPVPALARLVTASGGALLEVGEIAALPAAMRGAVARQRNPAVHRPTPVVQRADLPFLAERAAHWPGFGGHMRSRPRAEAEVYLATPGGDPLLAAWLTGAGRVAALPAGFGAWAREWFAWDGWPGFVDGLLGWLAGDPGGQRVHVSLTPGPGTLRVVVDVALAGGDWAGTPAPRVQVVDPLGRVASRVLLTVAPGRHVGEVAAPLPGPYRVAVLGGDYRVLQAVYHQADAERRDGSGADLARWHAAGLVSPLGDSSNASGRIGLGGRDFWLALTAGLYLLLIVAERRRLAFA